MIAVEPLWLLCIVAIAVVAVFATIVVNIPPAPLLGLALGVAVTVGFVAGTGRPPASWQPRPAAHHERACTPTIAMDRLGVWQTVCR